MKTEVFQPTPTQEATAAAVKEDKPLVMYKGRGQAQGVAPRTWAYLRVSTKKQDVNNQRAEVVKLAADKEEEDVNNQRLAILKLANDRKIGSVEFIEDPAVSGRVSWRERKIAGVMDQAHPGDTLIVAELSRLGRSMYEIMEILALAVKKGLRIYAVKGGWSLDNTLQSKILAMVFAMAAEIERDLNSQRTKAAMATRRAMAARGESWTSRAGNVVSGLGRPRGVGPSKLTEHEATIRERLAQGVPEVRIAKDLATTPANLRHWMRQHRIDRYGKDVAVADSPV